MTVRHLFLWSVTDEDQGPAVLRELASLPERIPGLRNWSIGKHVGAAPLPSPSGARRLDYGLTCDFDDEAALKAYQDDPAHQAVVERVLPLYADWAVVDLELG